MRKLVLAIILGFSFTATLSAQAAQVQPTPGSPDPAAGMDPFKKDVIDAVAKIGGLLGVLGGIWLIYYQVNKAREERKVQAEKDQQQKQKELAETTTSRELREEELRWRKAALAREVLNDLWEDRYCLDAMLMLDWDERDYCVSVIKAQEKHETTTIETITHADLLQSLRTTNLDFGDKEKYVRDCFDYFFGTMEMIQHYITIKLIEIEDVRYPFRYFLNKINRDRKVFDDYMKEYGFNKAGQFLEELAKLRPSSAAKPTSPGH